MVVVDWWFDPGCHVRLAPMASAACKLQVLAVRVQRGGQREHLWSDWSPAKLHPHVFWVQESDSGSSSTRFGPTEQQEQAACGAVVGPWKGVHISVWGQWQTMWNTGHTHPNTRPQPRWRCGGVSLMLKFRAWLSGALNGCPLHCLPAC